MAKIHLKRTRSHKVPPVDNIFFHPGDQILVWREKILANRVGEWVVPSKIPHQMMLEIWLISKSMRITRSPSNISR